jgi:hypothetical protein
MVLGTAKNTAEATEPLLQRNVIRSRKQRARATSIEKMESAAARSLIATRANAGNCGQLRSKLDDI